MAMNAMMKTTIILFFEKKALIAGEKREVSPSIALPVIELVVSSWQASLDGGMLSLQAFRSVHSSAWRVPLVHAVQVQFQSGVQARSASAASASACWSVIVEEGVVVCVLELLLELLELFEPDVVFVMVVVVRGRTWSVNESFASLAFSSIIVMLIE